LCHYRSLSSHLADNLHFCGPMRNLALCFLHLSDWHLEAKIGEVKRCFECVEETSTEDGVVRVVHVHCIKSYLFGAGIEKDTKRY
jgi:hypothetical protein